MTSVFDNILKSSFKPVQPDKDNEAVDEDRCADHWDKVYNNLGGTFSGIMLSQIEKYYLLIRRKGIQVHAAIKLAEPKLTVHCLTCLNRSAWHSH